MLFVMDKSKSKKGDSTEVQWDIFDLPFVQSKDYPY